MENAPDIIGAPVNNMIHEYRFFLYPVKAKIVFNRKNTIPSFSRHLYRRHKTHFREICQTLQTVKNFIGDFACGMNSNLFFMKSRDDPQFHPCFINKTYFLKHCRCPQIHREDHMC